MQYTQYWQIDAEVDKLFNEKKYDKCLELLNQALSRFPENFFDIVWYKAVIYAELQDYPECIHSIQVLIGKGFICPLHWRWFDPLRKDVTFHKLDTENRYLLAQAQEKAKMEWKLYLPNGYTQNREYSLFIVLHGDGGGGNIEEFSRRWKPDIMLKQDFIVAYVQSSQLLYHNNFGWLPDQHTAKKDILDCYDRICAKHKISLDNIIIGGFSGGAITSLEVTMANVLPVRGFICLCSELMPNSFTKENAELAIKRGVKGVLMEGEIVMPVLAEQEMLEVFQEIGFHYQFYVNEKVGHWFPNDFDNKLAQAIEFIMN